MIVYLKWPRLRIQKGAWPYDVYRFRRFVPDEVVDEVGESVKGLDALPLRLVLAGELLSLGDHALDVLLGETALLVSDRDGLGLATVMNVRTWSRIGDEINLRSLVGRANFHDTVGVNLEGDLDLRNTTGSGGDTSELELAEVVVVLGERTFTLEDLDEDGGLVISGGGETVINGSVRAHIQGS